MSRSAAGANEKIRLGVLGFGTRGSYMGPVFANNNPDCEVVAVADVSVLVASGSAVDAHAATNTTSIYTAPQNFPMLPERLSTDLTSLGQDEDRLAIVTEVVIDGAGSTGSSDVYRAAVRNKAKLAYSSVGAWLEGRGEMPPAISAVPGLAANLQLQDHVAQRLRADRHEHGALDLETLEVHARLEGDAVIGLSREEPNRAKQIIEDFMIAANGVTARFLERKGFPSFRRVLRSPERWERIVELAASLGEALPPAPDAAALEAFLARRRRADPLRFPDLSLSVIKLLGAGEYALELPGDRTEGHFGLAVRDYTHSTAPNRRFPDVITQRLLKAALDGRSPPYGNDALATLARHCTEQEGNATKVERRVLKSAAALLLQGRVGQRFEGIVTGAAEKGTWVRILQPPVEGRVVQGFRGLDVGDRVRVELVHTDVERGFIDFARAREG